MSNPFANPWTVAHQAPLSMGFPRQEYWSGLPWPPPGDLPDPGVEPATPVLAVDSLPLSHLGSTETEQGLLIAFLDPGVREVSNRDSSAGEF